MQASDRLPSWMLPVLWSPGYGKWMDMLWEWFLHVSAADSATHLSRSIHLEDCKDASMTREAGGFGFGPVPGEL